MEVGGDERCKPGQKTGGGDVQLASLIKLRVRSYAHPENRKNPICARFYSVMFQAEAAAVSCKRGWRAEGGGGGGGFASLINTPITGYQGVFASFAARPHLPGLVFRRVDGEAESPRSSRPPPSSSSWLSVLFVVVADQNANSVRVRCCRGPLESNAPLGAESPAAEPPHRRPHARRGGTSARSLPAGRLDESGHRVIAFRPLLPRRPPPRIPPRLTD